jgi:hypothetical protein
MANLRVDKITSTETFETTGSVQFDGTTDFLSLSSNTDFAMGTGDFTAECWVYVVSDTHAEGGYGQRVFDSNTGQLGIYINSDGTGGYVGALVSGTDIRPTVAHGIAPEGTWTHAAICRSGDDFRIFVNGREAAYRSGTGSVASSADFRIGARASGEGGFKGHISNLRVIKGQALYTANFKPSMRELEVIPGTVLLACQSKTDASLEKTGKTITVLGSASANELTPGILTPVVKSGGGSAITGSVEFDGTGDYLTIPNTEDLRLADSDFTIELWATISKVDSTYSPFALFENSSALRSYQLEVRANGAVRFEWWYNGSGSYDITTGTGAVIVNEWYHYAVSRNGATIKLFINGIEVGSADAGANAFFNNTVTPFIIGGMFQSGVHQQKWQGNISNFRINKGTALYTDDFIPPTRELKRVPGTVLLCCQDPDNPLTEATGKTITSNGDPAPSNFTPQVGDDRQITFEGVTKIDTDAYFYLPTGDTYTRDSSYGRGVRAGGYSGTTNKTIEYFNIAYEGESREFGDLTVARETFGGCSSSTRGLFAAGNPGSSPNNTDTIDFITFSNTADAIDFGNLGQVKRGIGSCSNQTRGIFAGGDQPGTTNIIDYVTVATTGNTANFGDLTQVKSSFDGCSSPIRAIFGGGNNPSVTDSDVIDYVTIASTGDALDFGNLTDGRRNITSCSSSTRALFAGGRAPGLSTIIDYVTIASTGNATDFGDLTVARNSLSGVSNDTRGVFQGGSVPGANATIDFVTIASTGNATAWGTLKAAAYGLASASDSHGGLG